VPYRGRVRWYLPSAERRPQPPSVRHGDDRVPVLAGTAAWAVLALIAWVEYDDLAADGRGWWLWTAVSGAVLGVVGSFWMQHRHNRGDTV
jgi:hypothetical protein